MFRPHLGASRNNSTCGDRTTSRSIHWLVTRLILPHLLSPRSARHAGGSTSSAIDSTLPRLRLTGYSRSGVSLSKLLSTRSAAQRPSAIWAAVCRGFCCLLHNTTPALHYYHERARASSRVLSTLTSSSHMSLLASRLVGLCSCATSLVYKLALIRAHNLMV